MKSLGTVKPAGRGSTVLMGLALTCGVLIAFTCAGLALPGPEQEKNPTQIATVGGSASAQSPVLNLLTRDYSIVNFDTATPPLELMPVLIYPQALDDQETMAYVIRVYIAGLTVGIINGTQDDLDRFDATVEGLTSASCSASRPGGHAALYTVQRALKILPVEVTRSCLPDIQIGTGADRDTATQWLRERFAAHPPAPRPEWAARMSAANSVNLESLSQKIHCDDLIGTADGQVQQDLFITSVRSFDALRDYYYVNKFDQFRPNVDNYRLYTVVGQPEIRVTENGVIPLDGTRLLFTEPDTTTSYVSGYTNSKETTVTGGVGFSGLKPEVKAELSVTIGKTTSVTVPPVEIVNFSNLLRAIPQWYFDPQTPIKGALFSTAESYVWYMDRDVYPDGGEDLPEINAVYGAYIFPYIIHGDHCGFPPPFPTFEVGAPHITSVQPAKTFRGGGTFVIHGEQMYPGIVSDVLLGGDPLPLSNFVAIDDQEIRVVVPSRQKVGLTPVQVNTFFNGKTMHSNSDIQIDIRP